METKTSNMQSHQAQHLKEPISFDFCKFFPLISLFKLGVILIHLCENWKSKKLSDLTERLENSVVVKPGQWFPALRPEFSSLNQIAFLISWGRHPGTYLVTKTWHVPKPTVEYSYWDINFLEKMFGLEQKF